MKVIVAGSRKLMIGGNQPRQVILNMGRRIVEREIAASGFVITELVCGMAQGVDTIGLRWAQRTGLPVKEFPAQWNDASDGYFNKLAGRERNVMMARYADALIAVWDGFSPGTKHMIECAKHYRLKMHVFNFDKPT